MWIWRDASSTVFSWSGTQWLPPVSEFEKHMRGQSFSTNDELKSATEQWLRGLSETFYLAGIEKLRDRYKLCIDKGGDYVEK
jgi:hypothetical protein